MKRIFLIFIAIIIWGCSDFKNIERNAKLKIAFLDTLEFYKGKPLDSLLFFDRHQYSKELVHENYKVSVYHNDTLGISYIVDNESQHVLSFHSIPEQAIKEANEAFNKRKQTIENQFSAWDGAHRPLEKAIKNSLADPDSYQHIETKRNVQNDTIYVETTFRAKNAFGGYVVNKAKGAYSLTGTQYSAEFVE